MNNDVFGKTMENWRKHRNIKLLTKKRRRNYLMSKLSYHTTQFFTENLSAIKKIEILINKPVYLGLSVLELSKKLWCDYLKPKYGKNAKFCWIKSKNVQLLNR